MPPAGKLRSCAAVPLAGYCGFVDGRNPFRWEPVDTVASLKPWLKPLFAGIYRGIISSGFLRECRISSTPSRWFVNQYLPGFRTVPTANQKSLRGALGGRLRAQTPLLLHQRLLRLPHPQCRLATGAGALVHEAPGDFGAPDPHIFGSL